MHPYLQRQNLQYVIIAINQTGDSRFYLLKHIQSSDQFLSYFNFRGKDPHLFLGVSGSGSRVAKKCGSGFFPNSLIVMRIRMVKKYGSGSPIEYFQFLSRKEEISMEG